MKHTYSSFKHSMRAGVKTAEDQQRFASVSTKLFKGEMKLLKKLYVSGPQIENAFHAFITSPITKAAVNRLLPKYYKREEEEALVSNMEYSRTPYFNLIHKIKTDLYSELLLNPGQIGRKGIKNNRAAGFPGRTRAEG